MEWYDTDDSAALAMLMMRMTAESARANNFMKGEG
jgi:hypothetical protein